MRNELNAIIVEKYRSDYEKACRKGKTQILNEVMRVTDFERKYLIKLFSGKRVANTKVPSGRPRSYTVEVCAHLVELHILMEQISPKRMKEAIPLWLPHYERHYGYLDPTLREKLLQVSSASIGRILKENRDTVRGKSSTRVNHKMKSIIPLKRLDEKVTAPGTVQADTVVHCGTSLMGEYANTLTLTDVHTSWTENRACWTKASSQIKKALEDIEKEMPIIMKHFDTDCGTEFLNYELMRYFEKGKHRRREVQMRRSRPYKKNDQCYVEQRNYTHVRNLFGYDRIENHDLVEVMNKIYKKFWNPLNNYFLPSFKLKEKVRAGGKIKKKFDVPKTPAQRLLDHPRYSGYMKRKVKMKLSQLDPVQLKIDLNNELRNFYKLLNSEKRNTA